MQRRPNYYPVARAKAQARGYKSYREQLKLRRTYKAVTGETAPKGINRTDLARLYRNDPRLHGKMAGAEAFDFDQYNQEEWTNLLSP